jgi:hypothetical protein
MAETSFRCKDWLVRGQTVTLHGIEVTTDGDPVIPHLGSLLEQIVKRPDCFEFQYAEKEWIAILPFLNQN